jgi:hypothetical protein
MQAVNLSCAPLTTSIKINCSRAADPSRSTVATTFPTQARCARPPVGQNRWAVPTSQTSRMAVAKKGSQNRFGRQSLPSGPSIRELFRYIKTARSWGQRMSSRFRKDRVIMRMARLVVSLWTV